MEGILYYDRMIDERTLYFGDHENQITKELDSITLDKPILLVRMNWEGSTGLYYALEVTQRTLDFLKEHRDWDYDYELYFNYRFEEKSFDDIDVEKMERNSTLLDYTPLTEEEFEEMEIANWKEVEESEKDPERLEQASLLMEAISGFHNHKFHDGKEFWKVNEEGKIVH